MNTLESYTTSTPFSESDTCAKFTIDEVLSPFTLHDIAVVDQQYTFSLWVKSDTDGHLLVHGATIPTTSEWKRYAVTFTAIKKDFEIFFGLDGTYYICHPQLELGNKASDWTVAPEDTETDISNAQSSANEASAKADEAKSLADDATAQITLLKNSISMLVTDANGASLMQQTSNGWTFCTGEIESAVNNTMTSVNELTQTLGSTNSTVDALQQAVNDLEETAEYVRIGVYEDEPCIELGESDSDYKLLITNTRILFQVGSDVPTSINSSGLVTKNIVVEEGLYLGGYVFVSRSNGNLGLMWKGFG